MVQPEQEQNTAASVGESEAQKTFDRENPGLGDDIGKWYYIARQLGQGAYGTVFLGVHRENGSKIAIKKTEIENKNDGIPSTTIREIAILTDLQHANIVKLHDIVMKDKYIYFI